ncbi:MAG: prolyl oligopeptidase family serine peptidase [Flavihumibacter sp.]|nr:prolyl oligopeptidase family serine peptidase [Flavihumibacter sp.]
MRKLLFVVLLLNSFALLAQDDGYKTPPAAIADLLLAKPTPTVSIDEKAQWLLLSERNSYPSVEELAQPELRIAGLRINPNNFALSRQNFINNFILKSIAANKEFKVQGLPSPLFAGNVSWSPDETKIAFTHTTNSRVDLYVIDVATQKATKINKAALNIILGGAYEWVDEQTLLYKVILKPAAAAPEKPLLPKGPSMQENMGKTAPVRTFQDLIKTPYDEDLFAFYGTTQLVKNNKGIETPIGKPAIYTAVNVSPGKNYLLQRTVSKPFSYLVPAFGFNSTLVVTDMKGTLVKKIADLPSAETSPSGFDNVQNSPRNYDWKDDEAATLIWVQPLDSGLIKNKVAYHDAVYALAAPFTGSAKELFKTAMRYRGVTWGNENTALVYEGLTGKQTLRMNRYNPATGTMEKLMERSTNDAYNNPGTPVLKNNTYNRPVLQLIDGGNALLFNNAVGSSPKGDLPFLAKFNLSTKQSNILWRCTEGYYEYVAYVLDAEKLVLLTRKESQQEVPNYFIKNLVLRKADMPLTNFANPYPQLEGITKQKISYKRADGVDLTGDLYLPKGYDAKKDGPLPVFMWAYPREFNSAADAAQVRGSQYRFTTINWGSPIYWVTQGYAVFDNAEMPIVATDSSKKPNDNFIDQLRMNAEAAVNKLSDMGVGDRNRMAVGGHSYGAFMTAHLLAHTKLFKAGIARSGAYNRTLTPFGFQNEDRTYWQAPDLYHTMSPFSYANKIKTPMLLIHGEMDDNQGTFPIQSERMYNAIKGHGGTVRYIQLPYEAHGYRGKENLLHMLQEQNAWLDKFVKNADKNSSGNTERKAF